MKGNGIADRIVQALEIGDLFGADIRKLVSTRENQNLTAAIRLLGPKRIDDVAAGLLGPIRARLRYSAGRQGIHGHVGPHHQQPVIALRRSELNVGILPRCTHPDAATLAASASAIPNFRMANSPGARRRPPLATHPASQFLNAKLKTGKRSKN